MFHLYLYDIYIYKIFIGLAYYLLRRKSPGRIVCISLFLYLKSHWINMLKKLWEKLCFFYFQYELITSIVLLSPLEKIAMNLFFLMVFSMIAISSYIYLPHYICTVLDFFAIKFTRDEVPLWNHWNQNSRILFHIPFSSLVNVWSKE